MEEIIYYKVWMDNEPSMWAAFKLKVIKRLKTKIRASTISGAERTYEFNIATGRQIGSRMNARILIEFDEYKELHNNYINKKIEIAKEKIERNKEECQRLNRHLITLQQGIIS